MYGQLSPRLSPLAIRVISQFPQCEILFLGFSSSGVHLTIDHPEGVDTTLTTQVAKAIRPLLGDTGIQVSSPGKKRPLITPEHFQKSVGKYVRVWRGSEKYYGELIEAKLDSFCLNIQGKERWFAYFEIEKAKVAK